MGRTQSHPILGLSRVGGAFWNNSTSSLQTASCGTRVASAAQKKYKKYAAIVGRLRAGRKPARWRSSTSFGFASMSSTSAVFDDTRVTPPSSASAAPLTAGPANWMNFLSSAETPIISKDFSTFS